MHVAHKMAAIRQFKHIPSTYFSIHLFPLPHRVQRGCKRRRVRVDEHNEDFTTSWTVTVSFLQLVRYRVKVSETMAPPSNAWNKNETIEKKEKERNNREIVLHPLYCVLSTRINQSDRCTYLFDDL